MIKRAQDMLQMVQDGVRNTMRVAVDLAESVGVPRSVTSLLQPKNGADQWTEPSVQPPRPAPAPQAAPAPVQKVAEPKVEPPVEVASPKPEPVNVKPTQVEQEQAQAEPVKVEPAKAKPVRRGKKRPVEGDRDQSKDVRPLEVDDAIDGSTYLARIIWSLGVADLEGIGSLRPADIARMVMSRSPVSLEPPNVARYIRRSKPTTISVDHVEGGSNYFKLNADGKILFSEHFR
jgi:hypothetical protein